MISQYKKHIIGFVIVLSIAIALELGLEYLTALPPFITKTLEDAKKNEQLMQEIGGYAGFESWYNPNDMNVKDTIDFRVTVKGRRKQVKLVGKSSKNIDGIWLPHSIKRDK